MGASTGSKNKFVSEINITPFVDVMLVLLIIFMVTAPMMTEGLEIDLPQTKQVDSLPTDTNNLVLSIRRDGVIYIDTYQVPFEELEARLNALVTDKDRPVYLQADKEVAYGLVVAVMGSIKSAGIAKIGIVATPEDIPSTPNTAKK